MNYLKTNLINTLIYTSVELYKNATMIKPVLAYEVSGFYKSGTIRIYEDEETLYAVARYDELTELDEEPFDSLVSLNYSWWQRSKERHDGWKNPDSKWLPYFLEKGLVKEIKTINYE